MGKHSANLPKECGEKPLKCRRHVTKMRQFVVVSTVATFCFLTTFIWNTWTPLKPHIAEAVELTDLTAKSLRIWTPLVGTFLSVILGIFLLRNGFRTSLTSATLFLFVGCVLRCLPLHKEESLIMISLGSALMGLAFPLVITGLPGMAACWFTAGHRITVMSFCVMAMSLGFASSNFIGPQVVENGLLDRVLSNTSNMKETDLTLNRMYALLVMEALQVLSFTVGCVFLYPLTKRSPESAKNKNRVNNFCGLGQVIRKDSFWIAFFAAFCVATAAFIHTSTFNDFVRMLHGVEIKAENVAFHCLVIASVALLPIGALADLSSAVVVGRVLLGGAVLGTMWTATMPYSDFRLNMFHLYGSQILTFTCLFGSIPIWLELLCDLAFPVAEEVIMCLAGCAFCISLLGFLFAEVFFEIAIYAQPVVLCCVLCSLWAVSFFFKRCNQRAETDSTGEKLDLDSSFSLSCKNPPLAKHSNEKAKKEPSCSENADKEREEEKKYENLAPKNDHTVEHGHAVGKKENSSAQSNSGYHVKSNESAKVLALASSTYASKSRKDSTSSSSSDDCDDSSDSD